MTTLASNELIQAMNEQIGHEISASLQYLGIAAYFDSEALPMLAGFFYRQSDEERAHALKFVKFVVDVGGEMKVPAIPAGKSGFGSAEQAVELSLESEKRVTDQIYRLVDIAQGEKNYIALRFLDWFVTEQLEEVSTMAALLQVVRRAGAERLLQVEDFLARNGAEGLESSAPGEAE
jgi:ferritin